MTFRIIVAIGVAMLAIAVLFVSAIARAHGDAEWIQKGNYVSHTNEFCCGTNDCFQVHVSLSEDGYSFLSPLDGKNVYQVPERDALQSENAHYWACLDLMNGRVRCFFRPAMGS